MKNLPSIYLIGDSISMGYHEELARACRGVCQYRRLGDAPEAGVDLDAARGANGGDSGRVLSLVRELLQEGLPEEHVVVNCGLHDIKRDLQARTIQTPPVRYRQNLEDLAREIHRAGKGLIWIRTTPVDGEQHRRHCGSFVRLEADAEAYNRIADEVMAANGVEVIDLHEFTAALPGPLYRDHVHFPAEISRAQAGFLRREFDRLLRPGASPLLTFLGDSITDAERDRRDPASLGNGYVAALAEMRPDARFLNLGVSGNRLENLRARLDEVPLETVELTLFGGINHVVHIFKRNRPETPAEFEAEAVELLTAARRRGFRLRVLLPFLCEADPSAVKEPWRPTPGIMFQKWRAELEPRLEILIRLCREADVPVVHLDERMRTAGNVSRDGVHPNAHGHRIIAEAWNALPDPDSTLRFR